MHVVLAAFSALTVLAVIAEGAVRAILGRPPGPAAERTSAVLLLAVGITAAAGLALLVVGHRPGEWLHVVYAILAFGLVPVADNAAVVLGSDRGKALARLGGAVVCLVVLVRLFQTG